MIHSKFTLSRMFPFNSARAPEQIDRVQDIKGDLTLNREKQYEIGREAILDYKKNIPSFSYTMRQFEFGDMKTWYGLANKANPGSGESHYVELDNIQTTEFDIAAFLTDDSNVFTGTIWFPKLRVGGFTLNIAAPDAILERNFTLIGEDYKILDGKYYSYQTATNSVPGIETMVLNPVAIEYASGDYIFRVLRIRAGVVTELLEHASDANTWSYVSGTATLSVRTCLAGDIIKVYYPSATAYTTLWTNNDTTPEFLLAENCEIYLKTATSQRIYKLQTIGIDAKLDRTDYREIGSSEIEQTGVRNKTVTVSLNRFGEGFTLEKILANDTAYPYINPRDFLDNLQMQVKIFNNAAHTSFQMGYLLTNLSPTALGVSQTVQEYEGRTDSLECDNVKVSDTESEIAFV